jgi:hypothetical protein
MIAGACFSRGDENKSHAPFSNPGVAAILRGPRGLAGWSAAEGSKKSVNKVLTFPESAVRCAARLNEMFTATAAETAPRDATIFDTVRRKFVRAPGKGWMSPLLADV